MLKRTLLSLMIIVAVALGFNAYISGAIDVVPAPPAAEPVQENTPVQPAAAGPNVALPEHSIYHLGTSWTNQQDERVDLVDLRGRPRLISMVFTHCGYACPRTVHDLKQIVSRLPEAQREEVGVVLVTIDPERDTPEVLARFAGLHDLDPTQWMLLRSHDMDVRTLAAVLGVRYREEAGGHFSHANLITLVGRQGEILYQQEGLGTDPAEMIRKLQGHLGGA